MGNKVLQLVLCFVLIQGYTQQLLASNSSRQPISTDSRIKTFVYSENEVFPIVLHVDYQTVIEFSNNEAISNYSVGNSYAWQFNIVGRSLFIKPMEENILTNMIVTTNKRQYYFELQSKTLAEAVDQDLAYVVRFFYPDFEEDSVKPQYIATKNDNPYVTAVKPYNFDYHISGPVNISPTTVFDDGTSTFFQYEGGIQFIPVVNGVINNVTQPITPRQVGDYLIVDYISKNFELVYNGRRVNITARN